MSTLVHFHLPFSLSTFIKAHVLNESYTCSHLCFTHVHFCLLFPFQLTFNLSFQLSSKHVPLIHVLNASKTCPHSCVNFCYAFIRSLSLGALFRYGFLILVALSLRSLRTTMHGNITPGGSDTREVPTNGECTHTRLIL